jgi:hypothetical protein
MEIKKEIFTKELYQVACMLERARTPEAVKLFSEKEYLRKELEKMWIILGPLHPSCFHLFKILKIAEDKYKALITGKVKNF